MSEELHEAPVFDGPTFWNVSATHASTAERWVHNGSREECELLLDLKIKEWGAGDHNIEWSEHAYSPA